MTEEPASCEFTRFQNQNGGEIEMGDNDTNSMKEKYEEPSSIGKLKNPFQTIMEHIFSHSFSKIFLQ